MTTAVEPAGIAQAEDDAAVMADDGPGEWGQGGAGPAAGGPGPGRKG